MYLFYYIDYYIFFIILFLLFLSTVNLKDYILFKGVFKAHTKINKSKIVYFNFKVALLFLFVYILLLSEIDLNFNLIFINKFLFIFTLLFLVFLQNYSMVFYMFNFEYILVLLFSILCLMLFIQCNNFLNFYILLESYSLCFCFAIVLKKPTIKLIESSFKYLIFNLVASLILLFSISYIYLSTGFINFSDFNKFVLIPDLFYNNFILNYAFILLIVSIFIKLTVFPFSLYILEIYNNLNIPYVLFLLTIPKFLIILCFTYFTNFLFLSIDIKVYCIIFALIFITSIVHSILCAFDDNIKSIIINISLANTPFLIIVLFSKSVFFFTNYVNFILIYFINLICFFSIFFLFCLNKKNIIKKKSNLLSLFYLNKHLFALIIINILSLSALPPFSNFFTKLYIFYVLIEYKLIYVYIVLSLLNLLIIYSFLDIIKILLIKSNNYTLKYFKIKKCFFVFVIVFLCFLSLSFVFLFDLVYMVLYNFFFLSIPV